MWIVRLALRRPYTFVVMSLLILILGTLAVYTTPIDIFPNIDIPIVAVVYGYAGLSAEDVSQRLVVGFERGLTATVNDVEHIESQSLNGLGVIKIFFYPSVRIDMAMAQVTAIAQSAVRQDPPGTTPPFILAYNASSVPIIQLALSGKGLSEQQLNDLAANFLRSQLATVQGAVFPNPYGGKQRQIQVDLNIPALQAKGLSPNDVVTAIGNQNLILPAGTVKIGSTEDDVDLNASPQTVEEMNDLPIKTVGTNTIYIRDVAHVRDGNPPQTNIVMVDGQRAALMTVLKLGNTSTLDIINEIKQQLPTVLASLPPEFRARPIADQSLFVRASINGVVREAVIAACLTGLMILIFLGSWRSTLIIAVSIPLSILTSIIVLSAIGQTINIMTLGGLALAVGILVDDATVEIENINRNLAQGKEIIQAILDGAQQIAVPAFVSTLSICIVFVPMFFLTGVAKYLFVPLAEAVVFAMLASYLLSRTLVPTMARYLLKAHGEESVETSLASRNPLVRLQGHFELQFERLRNFYRGILKTCLAHTVFFPLLFLAVCVASFALYPWLGEDFFPSVDAGQIKLHLRAPTATRIEETAELCSEVERTIHEQIPANEIESVIDNIGLPYSAYNYVYSTSAPIGPEDADIMISLNANHHPTEWYMHDLRQKLTREFPGVMFYFPPADIVSQILNFGLPAPIDIQIMGRDVEANHQFANDLMEQLNAVTGIADLRIQQPFNQPKLHINVDRTKTLQAGFTQRDVAGNLLVSLSGSFQTSPSFWLDPKSGVTYLVATQAPQYDFQSLQDLENIPVTGASGSGSARAPWQQLANLGTVSRGVGMATVSHYDAQNMIDIFGATQGRDLGGVAKDIDTIVNRNRSRLPRGSQIFVRGQIDTMRSSFVGLLAGLGFAILLIYLLIVVNFQSWLDPFIIISALPAALAGIVWMLFVTHTTISVPALTGSIMCMGVATANSILVVSFSKERVQEGLAPVQAAEEAGFTRFRPVIMTAMAMIIGMLPMAVGLGEGGEQNAPLGRAVIGGLLFATVATLLFVPSVYSLIHGFRGERGESAVIEIPGE
ncbi:MAG TPA: efflux RND transporter permease subunit [Candidatus Acidoferrum sp.]|jgi:multidrug efflux pump subunit AcrB|nr:efflux RND transporter permease subunit [Candidatus Acidoferrum sp.]